MTFRRPAMSCLAAILALGAPAAPLLAQPARPAAPSAAAAPATPTPGAAAEDPILARVDGEPIRLSDVIDAAADLLPPELRAVPPATLAGMMPPDMLRQLTERAITERALVHAARQAGLDRDEEVKRRIRRAEEQELQQALITREVSAAVSDEAVRARYDQEIGRRQGEEEVHARHILLRTETEAKAALAEISRPGADFAETARRLSTGPGAQEGGDLGFFKRSDMVAEFADAAFALQPGQTSAAPVRSQFGWHLIKVEERRHAPVPSFEESREALRQKMMEEQVDGVVRRILAAAKVERLDQVSPARGLLDGASPPPPAGQGRSGGTPAPSPTRR